jgi:hypothetical protein
VCGTLTLAPNASAVKTQKDADFQVDFSQKEWKEISVFSVHLRPMI